MSEQLRNSQETSNPNLEEKSIENRTAIEQKFRIIKEREELRGTLQGLRDALDEYSTLCEKMDESALQGELKSMLNSIGFRGRSIDRAKNQYGIDKAEQSLKIDKARYAVARDVYVKKYFSAAQGGLGSVDRLARQLEQSVLGDGYEYRDMEASNTQLPDELRLQRAALRAMTEVELGVDDKSTPDLYKLLRTISSQQNSIYSRDRKANVIVEVLATREGFDRMPATKLSEQMPKLTKDQQEVAQYVLRVLRDPKRAW